MQWRYRLLTTQPKVILYSKSPWPFLQINLGSDLLLINSTEFRHRGQSSGCCNQEGTLLPKSLEEMNAYLWIPWVLQDLFLHSFTIAIPSWVSDTLKPNSEPLAECHCLLYSPNFQFLLSAPEWRVQTWHPGTHQHPCSFQPPPPGFSWIQLTWTYLVSLQLTLHFHASEAASPLWLSPGF